jgi:hypothetical protein
MTTTAYRMRTRDLQEGLLVDRAWLQHHGFDRPAVDYYLRSGKLEAVAHGVYRKPGPALKWQNVIYSLSELGYRLHVGYLSALAFHGFQHYLELGGTAEVRLYSERYLPGWINDAQNTSRFVAMKRSPFVDFELGIKDVPFGTWDWLVRYASPERAFLELTSTAVSAGEIGRARLMMEGAANLKPTLLQSLLQECQQVKAKRLFLWMAREQGHSWYRHIDQAKIDLGSGKRQIVKGGVFDDEFSFTVPGNDEDGQTEPLF